ncbi:murein L,D-transpeptidase [Pseudoruegeria sp. SHC-113]|uniref:L,D-transpeptidase family protein n=1 Tax=Pseudoruegeria sp. SHC-113 TaxID=2855439 RepID=UPI0021BA72FD|nr:L,D-transpeptidase family protein [Pseudoruegeria sp. SHC-113]MCT8160563.1 L,D-transpeptidase family protein [Pseudoruegeria sp. SHC-113]
MTQAPAGRPLLRLLAFVFAFFTLIAAPVQADVTPFTQAVAEAAAKDKAIAEFYKSNGYKAIWTGNSGKDKARRKAFLEALEQAEAHGLPTRRYDAELVKSGMKSAQTPRDMGLLEVEMSRMFLQYAQDIQSGVLTPSRVDSGIVREIPRRNRTQTLVAFSKSSPRGFIRQLPPKSSEYTRLMKEKLSLEKQLASGGYGPKVTAKKLEPGMAGGQVVALRNRLIALDYMGRTASQSYDVEMQKAVQAFQVNHGLEPDGIAGAGTLSEVNADVEDRLKSVIVAMERERWMNRNRGSRHVWVNLTDFSAKIVDNGKVTFETRSVIGKDTADRRSPEFSDVMEFVVVNPTWNVPRSIATKEYLPMLKKNPNAVSHLKLINSKGQTVSRGSVNFNQFTARNFPFAMKQPPSRGNALGIVKFMFPNRHNIYLHDTPSKNLFDREVRAFSHGCIRLADPREFAHAVLAAQTSNPEGMFQRALDSGKETRIDLEQPIPVHIVYRTAVSQPKGPMQYRRDVYGRDAKVFAALSDAGVSLRAVRG